MRYLILIIFLFPAFYGCRTTESLIYYSEFQFLNETDSLFYIAAYNKKRLVVEANVIASTITTIKREYEHVALNPGQFFDSDSIEVVLTTGKKLIYSWYRDSPTSKYLGNGLGWTESKLDDNHFIYTYHFTQEHIDSAR